MGYTHYWTLQNGIEQSVWNEFLEGARQIIGTADEAGIQLEDKSSDSEIIINGVGAGAHETFVITSEDVGYDFCKTGQKPYDTVVTAILIHAKRCLAMKSSSPQMALGLSGKAVNCFTNPFSTSSQNWYLDERLACQDAERPP
jgi:microcompartment protein CcmK/EutM